MCLCPEHWEEIARKGYHFELYHLIYVLIGLIAFAVLYRLW